MFVGSVKTNQLDKLIESLLKKKRKNGLFIIYFLVC